MRQPRIAWASIRAALLTIVLVIEGVAALPIPRSIKRSSFEEPVAREELAVQRGLLSKIGLELTHEELVDVLFTTGSMWVSVNDYTLKPLQPFLGVFGIGQSWGLFTYPDTFPHQLIVEVRRSKSADWELWYAGLDPAYAWSRDVLTYRRVRGVYDGQTSKPGASWNNMTRWIAKQACAQDPGVQIVRVSFRRFHTVPPGKPPEAPVDLLRHARSWTRSQVAR